MLYIQFRTIADELETIVDLLRADPMDLAEEGDVHGASDAAEDLAADIGSVQGLLTKLAAVS